MASRSVTVVSVKSTGASNKLLTVRTAGARRFSSSSSRGTKDGLDERRLLLVTEAVTVLNKGGWPEFVQDSGKTCKVDKATCRCPIQEAWPKATSEATWRHGRPSNP